MGLFLALLFVKNSKLLLISHKLSCFFLLIQLVRLSKVPHSRQRRKMNIDLLLIQSEKVSTAFRSPPCIRKSQLIFPWLNIQFLEGVAVRIGDVRRQLKSATQQLFNGQLQLLFRVLKCCLCCMQPELWRIQKHSFLLPYCFSNSKAGKGRSTAQTFLCPTHWSIMLG